MSVSADGEQQEFCLQIILVNTLSDYPGYQMLTCQHGANALVGCAKCNSLGVHVKALDKTVYDEDVRRNLPPNHPFGTDPAFRKPECRPPFHDRSHSELLQAAEAISEMEDGRGKAAFIKATVVKGRSALFDAPYFDVARESQLDVAHVVANIGRRTAALVLGQSDMRKVREDLCNISFHNSTDWIVQKEKEVKAKRKRADANGELPAEQSAEVEEIFPPVD
jgi:hypothetical protein